MKYILGIDVGTSSVKCIIIDEDGRIVSSYTDNYPIYTPKAGWSEQKPQDWWEATKKAIRNTIKKDSIIASRISALGVSGQMHGLVALDEEDNVIRPAILWNDQRTQIECKEITEIAGGLKGLLNYTNNKMLTGYTGGKLVWLKKHEPENYKKMSLFLMPKDYIRFKMTGEKATEVSDASGTGLFDVKNRKWSVALIKKLELDINIFPRVYESDDIAGHITKEVAMETGLPEGLTVYAGGGDAVIQNTGMGIVKEGKIGLIIGTGGIVSMSLDSFGKNEGGNLQFFCNNERHKWQAFGCQLSSGGSLEWFKNAIYSADTLYTTINEQVKKSPVGAKKLIFLPYLTGERSPHADSHARGVFFGLSLLHDKGDMARAVMEGVTFGLKEICNLIKMANPKLKFREIIFSGGASKSKVWRQIQADIFGLPVKTLTVSAEGGAYGAAIVAGVGAGIWQDIEHAAEHLTVETVTEPNEKNKKTYDKLFEIYKALYADLKERFKALEG